MPTVLVVEDDKNPLFAFERHLSCLALSVIAVPNSMAALKVLEGTDGGKVNVLLTDIVTTDSNPHGIVLGLMAKQRAPNLQILHITGCGILQRLSGAHWISRCSPNRSTWKRWTR